MFSVIWINSLYDIWPKHENGDDKGQSDDQQCIEWNYSLEATHVEIAEY